LDAVYCGFCPLLTSVPNHAVELFCYGCPWLPQNHAAFPAHLPSLLRLQRWFRHGKKQVFKRVVRTRAFIEFIYDPAQIGGKAVKRQLEAELGAMRPEKMQKTD
jgi:hypothetical protein